MDMTTKEGVKISSDRCQDLIFEGDEIYYVRVKVGTNGFMKMNADGTGVTEVFAEENVYVTGVEKIGNTYYFVKNPAIGYKTLYTYTVGDTKATNLKLKAFEMVIVGEKIYYYDDTANALKRCDKNGENAETLVSNVDINDLCVNGTTVYYSMQAKTVGLYAYNTQTGANAKISDLVADGMRIIDGKLWFINTAVNYIETGGMDIPNHKGSVQGETIVYLGDGKLYCYDGVKVEKK